MADHLLGLLLMQLLRAAVERIVAAGAQDEVGAAVALDEVAAAGRLQEVLPGESVGIDLLRVEIVVQRVPRIAVDDVRHALERQGDRLERAGPCGGEGNLADRKSTRLNSSH